MELWDYQAKAHSQVEVALAETGRALMVKAPGLGKTVVVGHLLKGYLQEDPGFKTLYLCHETDILSQTEELFSQGLGIETSTARFYGPSVEKDWNAEDKSIVFATFQSMNGPEKWYTTFAPDAFDLIIVDEGHHACAPTYEEVVRYFNAKKVGMTATPEREDDKDIRDLFGEPVVNIPLEEGIAMGWLADVDYRIMSDGLDTATLRQILEEYETEGRRPNMSDLNDRVFIKARDEEQATIIEKVAAGRQTMIFCENILHAENFSRYLKSVVVVHSDKSPDVNTEALSKFREGKAQYIIAVDKLNEGIDVPDASVVVFLRVTGSKRILIQQLGRGLRKTNTKTKVTVLDFVANCERLLYIKELSERVTEFARINSNGVKLVHGFDVLHANGKHFNFTFSEELVDILEIARVLREGFYATYAEAKAAAKELGARSSKDYQARRRKDMQLPYFPDKHYSDWTTWDDFLDTEVAPDGWMTVTAIARSHENTDKKTVSDLAETFRAEHPEWFKVMRPKVGKHSEHLDPVLVAMIRAKLDECKPAPEGWMTFNMLATTYKMSSKTLREAADPYRAVNPGWFATYRSSKGPRCEYIDPLLVQILLKVAIPSKNKNKKRNAKNRALASSRNPTLRRVFLFL